MPSPKLRNDASVDRGVPADLYSLGEALDCLEKVVRTELPPEAQTVLPQPA